MSKHERIRKAMAKMLVHYQNQGKYLDLDGNTHTDSRGIVAAWKELDEINQEHKPQDSKPQDHY